DKKYYYCETGSFRPKRNHCTPKTIAVDKEGGILIPVSENPGLSTRRLSAAMELRQLCITCIKRKKCGLCTTERHHILTCQYANIYMSIFLIGGLAVEVNSLGHRRSADLNPHDFSIWKKLILFRSCGREYKKPRIHLKIMGEILFNI
ncbi:hypothetical protein NQ318_015790, partial [Aromia moschata]